MNPTPGFGTGRDWRDEPLTAGQIAAYLQVTPRTIRRWAREGLILCQHVGRGQRLRFTVRGLGLKADVHRAYTVRGAAASAPVRSYVPLSDTGRNRHEM